MANFISNGKFTNFTNGLVRVTVLGEHMSSVEDIHPIRIFSTLISIPDTGISLPLDTILGRNREINDIFDATGSFAGSTSGNETLIDKTQSITFADDFVYLAKNIIDTASSKSALYNMLAADIIGVENGLATSMEKYKVVGTNGNFKRQKQATSDRNHRYLFLEDGKLVVPQASDADGNVLLQSNTRVTAYNNFTLCIMLEFLTEFSSDYKQGYRFVYSSPSNLMWNEADDYNKISMDVQFLCDYRIIDKWFIDGPSSGEDKYAGTLNIVLDEDSIVDGEFSETVTTAINEKFPVVEATNGSVVRLYTKNANGVGYITSMFEKTKWIPIPVGINKVTGCNEGKVLLDYYMPIMDYDFENAKFVDYQGTATNSVCPDWKPNPEVIKVFAKVVTENCTSSIADGTELRKGQSIAPVITADTGFILPALGGNVIIDGGEPAYPTTISENKRTATFSGLRVGSQSLDIQYTAIAAPENVDPVVEPADGLIAEGIPDVLTQGMNFSITLDSDLGYSFSTDNAPKIEVLPNEFVEFKPATRTTGRFKKAIAAFKYFGNMFKMTATPTHFESYKFEAELGEVNLMTPQIGEEIPYGTEFNVNALVKPGFRIVDAYLLYSDGGIEDILEVVNGIQVRPYEGMLPVANGDYVKLFVTTEVNPEPPKTVTATVTATNCESNITDGELLTITETPVSIVLTATPGYMFEESNKPTLKQNDVDAPVEFTLDIEGNTATLEAPVTGPLFEIIGVAVTRPLETVEAEVHTLNCTSSVEDKQMLAIGQELTLEITATSGYMFTELGLPTVTQGEDTKTLTLSSDKTVATITTNVLGGTFIVNATAVVIPPTPEYTPVSLHVYEGETLVESADKVNLVTPEEGSDVQVGETYPVTINGIGDSKIIAAYVYADKAGETIVDLTVNTETNTATGEVLCSGAFAVLVEIETIVPPPTTVKVEFTGEGVDLLNPAVGSDIEIGTEAIVSIAAKSDYKIISATVDTGSETETEITVAEGALSASGTATPVSKFIVKVVAEKIVPATPVNVVQDLVKCSLESPLLELYVGDRISFKVIADSGYHIADALFVVNGELFKPSLINQVTEYSYSKTITSNDDITINVLCELIPEPPVEPIKITTPENTTLTLLNEQGEVVDSIYPNESSTVTMDINEGYETLKIVDVIFNGTSHKQPAEQRSYVAEGIFTSATIEFVANITPVYVPKEVAINVFPTNCLHNIPSKILEGETTNDFTLTAVEGFEFIQEPTMTLNGDVEHATISADKLTATFQAKVVAVGCSPINIYANANTIPEPVVPINITTPENTTLVLHNWQGEVIENIYPNEIANVKIKANTGFIFESSPLISYDKTSISMDNDGEYYYRLDMFEGGDITIVGSVIPEPSKVVLVGELTNCTSNFPIGHKFNIGDTVDFTLTADEGYCFSGTSPMLYENTEPYPFDISGDKLTATNAGWTIVEGKLEILAIAEKIQEVEVIITATNCEVGCSPNPAIVGKSVNAYASVGEGFVFHKDDLPYIVVNGVKTSAGFISETNIVFPPLNVVDTTPIEIVATAYKKEEHKVPVTVNDYTVNAIVGYDKENYYVGDEAIITFTAIENYEFDSFSSAVRIAGNNIQFNDGDTVVEGRYIVEADFDIQGQAFSKAQVVLKGEGATLATPEVGTFVDTGKTYNVELTADSGKLIKTAYVQLETERVNLSISSDKKTATGNVKAHFGFDVTYTTEDEPVVKTIVLGGTLENCSANHPIGTELEVGKTYDFMVTPNEGYVFDPNSKPFMDKDGTANPMTINEDGTASILEYVIPDLPLGIEASAMEYFDYYTLSLSGSAPDKVLSYEPEQIPKKTITDITINPIEGWKLLATSTMRDYNSDTFIENENGSITITFDDSLFTDVTNQLVVYIDAEEIPVVVKNKKTK